MIHPQLDHYLEDLIEDGTNSQFIHVGIPTSQENFRVDQVAPGVLEFHPLLKEDHKSPLILSCGIHGNETAPIEMVDDLLKEIIKGELLLKRPLQLIFGHLNAIPKQKRFLDFNLNRLFCGHHQGHPDAQESVRAAQLEKVVEDFALKYGEGLHLDLHTAIRPSHLKRFAVYPTMDNNKPENDELILLKAMGIEGILLSGGKASTFSAYSHRELNFSSFTLELGKVEPFGQNNRLDFQETYNTLRNLIQNTSPKEIEREVSSKSLKIFEVVHELIRENEAYEFHIAEDYANFTPLDEGEPLETTSQGILKAKARQAIVFPNSQVKIGQRSGLLVEEVETI